MAGINAVEISGYYRKNCQVLEGQETKNPAKSGACTTYGIRTRDSSVKGRRLNPLTNAAFVFWECKDRIEHITSQTNFTYFFTLFKRVKKRAFITKF